MGHLKIILKNKLEFCGNFAENMTIRKGREGPNKNWGTFVIVLHDAEPHTAQLTRDKLALMG